jgi:hypothetical protein
MWTKDMFLVSGGDEWLIVNGYVDSSFNSDLVMTALV